MLITKQDYGVVELRLKEIMEQKGITRGLLSRCVGTRFEVIDRWYNGDLDKLDLDILARICCALECEISDILVYHPRSEHEV